MVVENNQAIDKKINELKAQMLILKSQLPSIQTVDLLYPTSQKKREEERSEEIKKIGDRIFELEKMKLNNVSSNKTNEIKNFKLWDIIIIPQVCIIIWNYAISDYNTYDKMRRLLENGIELYITKDTTKPKSKLLGSWQFSSWLKFLYAMVKYIISNDIIKKNDLYELNIDKNFISYFKEAGKHFDFINKENSDLSYKTLDYWKGPRNYCKKILWRCSEIISIDSKEVGKREMKFYVRKI